MLFFARGVTVEFEGVVAVDQVDCELNERELLGLIGPNGAGKTTLLNVLTGFQRPTEGAVFLGEAEVTNWPPHRLARQGIVRTFQTTHYFGELTTLENVEVGSVALGLSRRHAAREAEKILRLLGIEKRKDVLAKYLPYGEGRKLAVGRAIATSPRFLLLDEPAAGLNEVESAELGNLIAGVRDEIGCGVLIIEHDMRLILSRCDRIQVLDHGKTLAVGSPKEIRTDSGVISAYLGAEAIE